MFRFHNHADTRFVLGDFQPGYISQACQVLEGRISKLTDAEPETERGKAEIALVRQRARNILANCSRKRR